MTTPHELDELRTSIDRLDNALVAILAERFQLTKKVGIYKAEHGLQPIDSARELAQFEKMTTLAQQYDLEPQFANKFLRQIIDEVVMNHKSIAEKWANNN